MNIYDFFGPYEELLRAGDSAFEEMSNAHPDRVRCKRGCDDCCHAVFGLFLVEAAYLHEAFARLDESVRSDVLERCKTADEDVGRLEEKLRGYRNDPAEAARVMATERLRCPLLTRDRDCVLYHARPLTCRVYGIPTLIQGSLRVCGKSGFSADGRFGAFNFDVAQRHMLEISTGMLEDIEEADPGKASLLFSVSKSLKSPVHDIIEENCLKED
ncbi:MAG: YkgJ family cysteine cluster protein [Desulfatiglandaceae bacterium]